MTTTAGDLTHVVLTRFNVAVSYSPAEHRLSEAWLRTRLEPFESVCLPSMRSQLAAQDGAASVRWVVLCDAASPAWFTQRMAGWAPDVDVVHLAGPSDPARVAAAVTRALRLDTPWLLTTRLDSDDALAADHLARLQRLVSDDRTPRWIDTPVGMQLLDGALYLALWRSNPFLSLLEEVRPGVTPRTALSLSHSQVRTGAAGPVQTVWTRPAWLQTLHGANASSGLIGVPAPGRSGGRGDPRFPHVHASARGSWPRSAAAAAGALRRRLPASGVRGRHA